MTGPFGKDMMLGLQDLAEPMSRCEGDRISKPQTLLSALIQQATQPSKSVFSTWLHLLEETSSSPLFPRGQDFAFSKHSPHDSYMY